MYEKIGYCAALFTMSYLAGEDIKRRELSLCILVISGCVAILYLAAGGFLTIEQIAVSIFPGVMLLVVSFFSGETIGYGDGVATLVLGLWTGSVFCMQAVGLGFALTGLYAIFVLGVKKKQKQIPFVPFLLLAMEVLFIYV